MKSLCILFFISLIFSCIGQENTQQVGKIENALLWKISGPKYTSYLYGTVHLMPKDKFFLPNEVKKCLKKSDQVIFEVGEEMDSQENMSLSMMSSGHFSQYLSQVQKDSLYQYAKEKFGLDSVQFENQFGLLKPFVFMEFPMLTKMLGAKSYDMELLHLARENKKKITGLETFAEQIGFFDQVPNSLQAEMIMQPIREADNFDADWTALESAYLNQDLAYIAQENKGKDALSHFFETTLLTNRNKNWIPLLEAEFKRQGTFVAVGAAHLAGQNGLIQLLRNEGFTVEPIEINLHQK